MGKSIFFRIVMVFIIIAAIAGLGAFAYQAGLAQGGAQAVVAGAATNGTVPYAVPYAWPMGFHHFGLFGIFGLLVPIFFFLIIFGAVRGLLFGRYYGWRHHMRHGYWGMRNGEWDKEMDVPQFVEDWHRRMHGEQADRSEDKK